MPIKAVKKMGEDTLFQPSLPVKNFDAGELEPILKDMRDTMLERGGVGIAAPQVGYPLRIIMFGFERSARYPHEQPIPFTILINPMVEILEDEQSEGWEGCLSVPGMRGKVPRFKKIRYSGYDPNGKPVSRVAENFHARVVQHEMDHIDGILFPQRINDMRLFGYEDILWKRIYGEEKPG